MKKRCKLKLLIFLKIVFSIIQIELYSTLNRLLKHLGVVLNKRVLRL